MTPLRAGSLELAKCLVPGSAGDRGLCLWLRSGCETAMERREAPVFLKRERGMTTKDAPLGAPSPRLLPGREIGKTVYPAPQNHGR
jgi:hypothetical protein